MEEDIAAAGTDSFADADFVSAFGNRDEHDIHDTDAADDEGNAGNEGKHARDNREEGTSGMGNFIAGENGEILFTGFGSRELFGDDVDGVIDVVGSGDFDVDLLNLKIGESSEITGVDEHGGVEIDVVEIDGVVDGIEDANDHEFFV